MRKIDSEAESLYGIPGVVLMENAGIKVYNSVTSIEGWKEKRICIIAGCGNNGGDGFAAARHIYSENKNLAVYTTAAENSFKGDALINYNIIRNMGIDITHISSGKGIDLLVEDLKSSGIVVDGLFGTGLQREVTGLYAEIIDAVNRYGKFVLSIDIPSGIDADSGKVLGIGVRADCTVTFAAPKTGLYLYPGADYAGRIFIEDISIPKKLIEDQYSAINILTHEDVTKTFKKRKKDSNKGTYGRAFIAAGSKDMPGAAVMCIKAALKCGAGIVEAGVPRAIQNIVASSVPEAIIRGVDDEMGCFYEGSWENIHDCINKSDAFAVGPGLSTSDGILDLMKNIISNSDVPCVIDADGLNVLSLHTEMLYNARSRIILTPHPGEMARLTGMTTEKVQEDRIGCALGFSKKYNVIVVLKGANTVIASPDGPVFINTTGNPGMAKGGSGDVLTGMIAAFLAQGIEPLEAAKAAVFVHGLAGDMAENALGEYGMGACDIIEYIPYAIRNVSEQPV